VDVYEHEPKVQALIELRDGVKTIEGGNGR